jgi:hypothetical protein
VTGSALAELSGEWSAVKIVCPQLNMCRYQGKLIVRNQGSRDARHFTVQFYRSQKPWFDRTAIAMTRVKVGRLGRGKGTVVRLQSKIYRQVPADYVIAVLDADETVAEANAADNSVVSTLLSNPRGAAP